MVPPLRRARMFEAPTGPCEHCGEPGRLVDRPLGEGSGIWCDQHLAELARSPRLAPTQWLVLAALALVVAWILVRLVDGMLAN